MNLVPFSIWIVYMWNYLLSAGAICCWTSAIVVCSSRKWKFSCKIKSSYPKTKSLNISLTGLNKSDKIGDVGGRNFYLHKNDSSNGLYLQGQEPPDVNSSCSDLSQNSSLGQPSGGATNQYQVLTIVISKLDKIGRRTRRIWRFITCNNCSWQQHNAWAARCATKKLLVSWPVKGCGMDSSNSLTSVWCVILIASSS